MYQQTSATTCKAHDFYYSIKINARDISVDINIIVPEIMCSSCIEEKEDFTKM